MKDIVKEKQLKEVLYGLDYIANKSKSGKLELGVNNCKLLLEEIERLHSIIKEVRKQLDYLETYCSEEDVLNDMKRRLDRIEEIIDKVDKENKE